MRMHGGCELFFSGAYIFPDRIAVSTFEEISLEESLQTCMNRKKKCIE